MWSVSNVPASPYDNLDEILSCVRGAVWRAESEEDLRIGVSSCIEEKVLKPLKMTDIARYEYTITRGKRVIGRPDALYGRVVVEYKAPGGLDTPARLNDAVKQIVKYIKALSKDHTGVIISDKIVFVKYDDRKGDWVVEGPLDVDRDTIARLIDELIDVKMSVDYERALDLARAMFVLTIFTAVAVYVFGGLEQLPLVNQIRISLMLLLPLFAVLFVISLIRARKIKRELDEERRGKLRERNAVSESVVIQMYIFMYRFCLRRVSTACFFAVLEGAP